jgi:DNA-binding IclR family transcriptional regulator
MAFQPVSDDRERAARVVAEVDMKSVGRMGEILRCFTATTPELSLPELSRLLGLSKATVHRYASALNQVGLLSYDEQRYVYGIGPEALRLATVLLRSFTVQEAAAPLMRRLTRELDQTTTLSVWYDGAPVVVWCESGTGRDVRQVIAVGTRLPEHSSAGLVFLAFGRGAGAADGGSHDLEAVRRHGIAVSTNLVDGMRAVGAPIFRGQEAVAALAVIGPQPIVPEEPDSVVARSLLRTADEITRLIGGRDLPPTRETDTAGRSGT